MAIFNIGAGGGSPTLEARTVTPSTEQQIITPSRDEYDGLSQVTVEATPLETRTVNPSTSSQILTPSGSNIGFSTITVNPYRLQSKSVTPSTSSQSVTPDSGYNGLSSVYVRNISLQTLTRAPQWKTLSYTHTGGYQGIDMFTVTSISDMDDAYWYYHTVFTGNGTITASIPITLPFEYVITKTPIVKMCICGSLSNTIASHGLNFSSNWNEDIGFGGVNAMTFGWNEAGYVAQESVGVGANIVGNSSDWPNQTLTLYVPSSSFPFVNGWQYAVAIMVQHKVTT